MILKPGFKLGKYLVKEQLGEPGGFGVVFRAVEDITSKEVAIKEFFSAGNQMELQVLAMLEHPNIIQYITYEEYNSTYFLVMEYASGGNLADIITGQGNLREDEALQILKQIAGALSFAHQQNIVHRDVKPLNIMWCKGNICKLGDFGIARLLDKSKSGTRGRASVYYAAPELFKGQFTRKTDVYALGVTFYEMLTGNPPYTGTEYEVIGKIADEKVRAEMPAEITQLSRSILEGCLEKEMNMRWDIERLLNAIGGQAADSCVDSTFIRQATGYGSVQPTVGRVTPVQRGNTSMARKNLMNVIDRLNKNESFEITEYCDFKIKKPFIMPIDDTFSIKGRGIVVTGCILNGRVKIGDTVQIVGNGDKSLLSTVTGIEFNRKLLDFAEKGQNIGMLLRNAEFHECEKGRVVCTPKIFKVADRFICLVYFTDQNVMDKSKLYGMQMLILHSEYTATINNILAQQEQMQEIDVCITCKAAIYENLVFAVRLDNVTIGLGIIVSIK